MIAFQIATLVTSFVGLLTTITTLTSTRLNSGGMVVFWASLFGFTWAASSLLMT